MSAHQRARPTSSSKTSTTAGDVADPVDPSSPKSPSHATAQPSASLPTSNTISPTIEEAEMLTTLAVPASMVVSDSQELGITKDGFDGPADDRSSSLSELGDASDVQSVATPRPTTAVDANEDESEAETERLEITPRKLTRTATETSLASEQVYQRTPSKLVHSKAVDDDSSVPPTPSLVPPESAPTQGDGENSALHALSVASEAASLAELAGKKRKRPSPENSSLEEDAGEPARKRSAGLNGTREAEVNSLAPMDAEEELENAEERISQLAQEEADLEERQANIAVETVNELATVAKHTKPRKGGRRGKRKVLEESLEAIASIEAEGEGDGDEEDSGIMDEEVVKKKLAITELAKIEKKFKLFREKLCDEEIARHEADLEMLRQPHCTHPEYLAMIKCIDDRRAEKVAYERKLLLFKQRNLEIITEAERHQQHSQFLQTVRDVRERVLSDCNQRIFELQRGRRQLGVEEVEYTVKLPEKRSDQIRQQAAYNLEVSILSGIAKYVGFPAAPEIRAARPAEVDDDLRAMKIVTRPTVPPPPVSYVRPAAYGRTSTADEAAAEEQFLERTPWANPQHPAHQQSHYGAAQNYQTPIGQRRFDPPNGSASTIEAHSNPPSSGMQATNGNHLNGGRIAESESPVLQMKRHPLMDQHHQHHQHLQQQHPHQQFYAESPSSLSRHHVSREAAPPQPLPLQHPHPHHQHHVLSSPATGAYNYNQNNTVNHHEADDQAARWGSGVGMRPGIGVSSIPPPPPSASGRPDAATAPAARMPMVQRVGGNGMFGR
ncbi:unnamed protein product [Periconia digitata]|uniref:Sds3-like-domain-containing protein n=1 Tax=Periconia digitata TaxID=1303443 RepID=A0A9W4UA50_9PLEO|nr:unnamed protein product [Periconia digitata]